MNRKTSELINWIQWEIGQGEAGELVIDDAAGWGEGGAGVGILLDG